MDIKRTSACVKFRPNQFDKSRCQTCFRANECHSADAIQANKMSRKVTKCGYLYVAPTGIDFSNPSHRNRRWQRRWFALYDDGELSYALDQHADTVPQGVVDMTTCVDVRALDGDSCGQNHAILVATRSGENHYFKGDSAEEIKWWYDVFSIYAKQIFVRKSNGTKMRLEKGENLEKEETDGKRGVTLVRVKNDSSPKGRIQRRTSDPLSQAKVDGNRTESYHGTPRSVKNRKTSSRCKDDARSKTFSEFGVDLDTAKENAASTSSTAGQKNWTVSFRAGKNTCEKIESESQVENVVSKNEGENGIENRPQNRERTPETISVNNGENGVENNEIDPSYMHTLRKGWLMLKGRSENDWTKHWVVLAGLSLKMYKDAWAEDSSSEATIKIDLIDCDFARPMSTARNYGIEIKCKHSRYVLSAMTPGIRDSWIAAIQQNLANAANIAINNNNNETKTVFSNVDRNRNQMNNVKKKRIAYVAPESHRRDASGGSDSEEDEDEEAGSFRSSSRGDEASISGRSVESNHDLQSDDGDMSVTWSRASTPRRRRSLSPNVRRSPVSRVKERDTSRRQRSPGRQQIITNRNTPPPVIRSDVIFDSTTRISNSETAKNGADVVAMLKNQLETVRAELERTRTRLDEQETENERLKNTRGERVVASANRATHAFNGESEAELERLRKTLTEAERDIWFKQEEIELLTRKLDVSVAELSDTETVLSAGLGENLDSERAKFSSLSTDWSRRVCAMERQLRDAVQRLDERERHLRERCDSKPQPVLHHVDSNLHENTNVDFRAANNEIHQKIDFTNCEIIAQLEAKLSESESQVQALTERVRQMENSGASSSISFSKSTSVVTDESTTTADKNQQLENGSTDDLLRDYEIRFESLRHYCHDQNRRLLATLRNETEFLQGMVEAKIEIAEQRGDSSSTSSSSSNLPELIELRDDLTAVHRYIGEIDRQPPPEQSDFTKDFNFKDVLNRLVEVQERLAVLSKRDEYLLSPVECYGVDRSSSEHSPVTAGFSSWPYEVTPLHADLARSISTYFEKKYEEAAHRPLLTSDDLQCILTETLTLETCLICEIATVIESGTMDDGRRLQTAVALRDIRNAYVILRRLDDSIQNVDMCQDNGVRDQLLAKLCTDMDSNFFQVLCKETSRYVATQIKNVVHTLPGSLKEKLHFNAGNDCARAEALSRLAKILLRDSVSQESRVETPLDSLRSSVLNEELRHILARLEAGYNEKRSMSPKMDDSRRTVAFALKETLDLIEELSTKIDDLIAEKITSKNVQEDAFSGSVFAERLARFLTAFLARFHNQQQSDAHHSSPVLGSSSKMIFFEKALQEEKNRLARMTCAREDLFVSKRDFNALAGLFCARLVVAGYALWLNASFDVHRAKTAEYSASAELEQPNFKKWLRAISAVGAENAEAQMFKDRLSTGLTLDECVWHYEPLTKRLFYECCSNTVAKIIIILMSVHNEAHAGRTVISIETGQSSSNNGVSEILVETNESQEELEQLRQTVTSSDDCTNLAGEVAELEQELFEMQSSHNDEMDALRITYANEIEELKRGLVVEQERRRKLYHDMETMKAVTDHSLAAVERAHAQLVEELRNEHKRELQRLLREHETTLREEKEATRHALDALQKAHEFELHKQADKLKQSLSNRRFSDTQTYENGDGPAPSRSHDMQETLEQISKELSDVSSAYSTKCLESSRLEDELNDARRLLEDFTKTHSLTDDQCRQLAAVTERSDHVRELEAELSAKEDELRFCQERMRMHELELTQTRQRTDCPSPGDQDESIPQQNTFAQASPAVAPITSSANNENGFESSSDTSSSDEEEENNAAAEYKPKTARQRRGGMPVSRRGDSRYHSTPNLDCQKDDANALNRRSSATPDRILLELRNVMGLSVSERRKYFEDLCKPCI